MIKNMTQLDIWIQINQIYNTSKPRRLIQSYIIKANMLFIAIITSPTIIGLLLLENKYFYLWMTLVLYFTLIVIFSDKVLQDNYTNNAIYDFPILQRRLYLHYVHFKNNCDLRLGFINQVDMHSLIEWHKQSIKPQRFHKHREAKIQVFLIMYLQDKKTTRHSHFYKGR